ncbi:protein of unknown function [Roseovarius nanhaiticus]|uniref:DUF1206 domain-containing protein n=1 Tax=Roseovarius nanhaiticus TaxID=573024 RepID=A0A1N7ETD6_9RHOB|nr:DUF1206 domain-containing protein [Roseovarius nanhaiticus]SEK67067.1 protein of unknown function [Roseovarius nanhaiticus]SIR91317.1 protein of unknown function [Roseovarius nanhaiticus]
MANKAPAWVVPVMRAGYGARGLVYLTVGALALWAVFWGGAAQGTQNALADLKQVTFGYVALWLIGLGLIAYMVWRLIDAAMDLEDEGSDAKGIFARLAQAVTGLIHGILGLSIIRLGMGQGGSGAENWTAKLMSLPYGPSLVAIVGAVVIGAGIYYVQKGLRGKYREDIRITPVTRKLDPLMKAGFVAEGVIVGTIGGFLLYAGLTSDPGEAGGVGQALGYIRALDYGAFLFAALALGLLCFALENMVEAVYRILPRYAGPDVSTLASRAKVKAKAHT